MKKPKISEKFLILLVITIFCYRSCRAEIITTSDFNVIEDYVKSARDNTLVIFDIDDVLLQSKDFCLKNYYLDKEQEKSKYFFKKINEQLSIDQQSEMIMQIELELIDLKMVKLINTLQKNSIKVLALTARTIGKFGKIPYMENLTIKELHDFGYHFENSWLNLNDQIFYQITPKSSKEFAMFKQGVLLTNGAAKGNVLKKFLDYAKLHPKKIIFIDDYRKNLESVAYFANKENIIFLGIEYTIAKELNKKTFNEERANFQLDIFKNNNKWLSDQQADQILHKKKIDLIKTLSKEVYLEQKMFPKGDYKDPFYIKKIIKLMYSLDQKVRSTLGKAFLENSTDNMKLISTMDQFHTEQMKKILQEHGWINISKFGKEADNQAWLLVQHADHDPLFQAGCAFILEKLIKLRETNQLNYAYLYDRAILKFENLRLKQKYGTQAIRSGNQITLLPYEGDIRELNKRRKTIGLDPVEKYLDRLTTEY